MRVGFIGIGRMGYPMARNLTRAGHQVIAYNRTRSRAEALKDDGAIIADTPADACKGDVVITMLADDSAVEQIVFGDKGFFSALTPETVHLSMGTISVTLSERLKEAHSKAGCPYVAATVFGRPDAAADRLSPGSRTSDRIVACSTGTPMLRPSVRGRPRAHDAAPLRRAGAHDRRRSLSCARDSRPQGRSRRDAGESARQRVQVGALPISLAHHS